ncbi:transcription elongation factor GreAB [Hymenobacter lutimineralis]|uniref:Transcription elongation factor GreAB n=1 Tax=Hymenobacter lutimineralis TaxID=2606448 RepID=A0A5D6VHU3_9BACT|nr:MULTISPECIES: GreA/GreB family elongation factor [Hymenobacter]QIX60220.1 transcription elongation factor GreAB [Hymenobacter sp. BT18]TYZ14359.1 transcription elongation factor GreAB [Hymenobacter lutimineralis]
MSRAFAKEEDSLEAPIIPPRAALPPGTPNYVTPRGLELLRQELQALEAERTQAEANRENEADRTRQLTVLNGRLSALSARLATAKVVDPRTQPPQEVRFGATVTLRTVQGAKPGLVRSFTLVGVDEASVAEGRVAFISPIARAIQGARLGQQVRVPPAETVEITAICYPAD